MKQNYRSVDQEFLRNQNRCRRTARDCCWRPSRKPPRNGLRERFRRQMRLACHRCPVDCQEPCCSRSSMPILWTMHCIPTNRYEARVFQWDLLCRRRTAKDFRCCRSRKPLRHGRPEYCREPQLPPSRTHSRNYPPACCCRPSTSIGWHWDWTVDFHPCQ